MAFSNCGSLASVTIGNSVTSIGFEAFVDCGTLASVYFLGNAPTVGSDVFFPFYTPTVYYLPGTTGWGATFGGCPTTLLNNVVPAITLQPQSQTLNAGETATFTVTATGTSPLSYQWLFNGVAIGAATTYSYIISNVQVAEAGGYSVVISNTTGSVTSAVAVLTIQSSHGATATATVVDNFVVGVTITAGGYGYTNTPTVRIIGGGSGAEAVAVVSNGVVTAVNIVDTGDGYTNTPVIVIAPPFIPQPTMGIVPLTSSLPVVGGPTAQLMQLGMAALSPYDNYQLQFAPVAGGLWTNFAMPFSPTSTVSTQDVIVTGNAGYFRVKYLP